MTADLCHVCAAPAAHVLRHRHLCVAHLSEVFRQVRPEVWLASGGGRGLPQLQRPDIGDGYAELVCAACGASWVGPAFGICPYCERMLVNLARWRAQDVLTPPEVDPDDRLYEARMKAWAGRLAVAVEAEIVTRDEARRAWQREVSRVAA